MKGYLKQKGIPTPDKPIPIETQVIGKNLFETYKVNSRQYTDNLPKNALISISKKQYIEYEQQKEEIERLKNKVKEINKEMNYQINLKTKNANEINRLNNIINEIKKLDLYISEEDYDYEENLIDKYVPIDIEDYIKELGDSSNE